MPTARPMTYEELLNELSQVKAERDELKRLLEIEKNAHKQTAIDYAVATNEDDLITLHAEKRIENNRFRAITSIMAKGGVNICQ